MAANDKEMGGAPITAQELFEHVATLAGLGYENAERAAALHDEAQRCLSGLNNAYNLSQKKIQALAEELRQKYAPASVEAAALAAQRAAAEFEGSVKVALEGVQAAARDARQAFWIRTAGFAMTGLFLVAAIVSLVVWWVPSVDEIKQRQAEAAELDGRLHLLRSVLDEDGKKWVPIIEKVDVCRPQGSTNCTEYGRVQ